MGGLDLATNVELYRRGRYDLIEWFDAKMDTVFRYHKKQIKALEYLNDDTTTYVGYGGAARGGKSVLLGSACIFECYAYPESRQLVGRKNLQQLYGTTFKTLMYLLEAFNLLPEVNYRFNGQRNEIKFLDKCQSEIILKNLELLPSDRDATAFGSLEIHKSFVDQSENVDLKIISKLGERSGSHHLAVQQKVKGKVLEAFNPLKQSHTTGRYWLPFKNDREKQTVKFVRALPSDNPSESAKKWVRERTQDYKDGSMSDVEYRKQILGDFDQDDNPQSLINGAALEQSFHNEHILPIDRNCLVADLAGSGKDSFAMFVFNNRVLIDHIVIEGKVDADIIEAHASALIRTHNIALQDRVFDADGMGDIITGSFKGARRFKNGSTNDKTRFEKFKNLKSYCAFKFAEQVNQGNYYFKEVSGIEDRLRRELPYLQRKNMINDVSIKEIITKDKIKKSYGKSPDLMDVCIMHEHIHEFSYKEGGIHGKEWKNTVEINHEGYNDGIIDDNWDPNRG